MSILWINPVRDNISNGINIWMANSWIKKPLGKPYGLVESD